MFSTLAEWIPPVCDPPDIVKGLMDEPTTDLQAAVVAPPIPCFSRRDRTRYLTVLTKRLASRPSTVIARDRQKSRPQRIALSDFRPVAKSMDVLTRARALHENRCCPRCRRAGAVPLDLGDGDDRNAAMPVPGSATLVGFYCDACGAEWPV